MDKKQNRAFIGLPLNKKQMISHVQLSQFRNSLTFTQQVNLTVYILHHLRQNGLLDGPQIHCVDSTELAVDCQQLLAKITINGQNIRIYDDIDCDCGVRRKNGERPFNLLKKREGLEKVLVRSQRALIAKSTFTTIATLLLEIAGTRRKKKKPEKKQMSLFDEALPKAVNL